MSDKDINQMQNTAEGPEGGTADIINEETAGNIEVQPVNDGMPRSMQAQSVKEDMPAAEDAAAQEDMPVAGDMAAQEGMPAAEDAAAQEGMPAAGDTATQEDMPTAGDTTTQEDMLAAVDAAAQEGMAQEKTAQESATQGPSAWKTAEEAIGSQGNAGTDNASQNAGGSNNNVYQNAGGQNGSGYQDANIRYGTNMYQGQAGYQNPTGYQNSVGYQNGPSYGNQNANTYQNPNFFQQGGNGAPNNTYTNANVYGNGNGYGRPNGQNGYPYGGAYQESPYQGAPIAPISQETPEPPMKVSDWVLTLLVLAIPCVNIIMLFIWGFGTTENRSKANFCKAALIWTAVVAALGFILYMVIVAGVIAGLV